MRLKIRAELKNIKTLRMIVRMVKQIIIKIKKFTNGLGSKRKCYICGKTFSYFTNFKKGAKGSSEFLKKLNWVSSDFNNFGCMYCACHDRERHLFMFFDELALWENMKQGKILHFAPERHLPIKISEQSPLEYIKADLNPPENTDIRKIDAIALPFNNNTFDFLIANHILEHIPDYCKALSEFYRVLKPGGIAVLQTPYSKLLSNNFEEDGIDSDELRLFFYGQKDHVRTFALSHLLKSLEDIGFDLQIKKHDDYFDARMTYYYGVQGKEDLMLVVKPTN
jgi:SAM-dependent methyltransferase